MPYSHADTPENILKLLKNESFPFPNKTACLVHNKVDVFSAHFVPPLDEFAPGQAKRELLHTIIYNVPHNIGLKEIIDLWQATKIDPPCFWLQFDQLGAQKEINGRLMTLEEVAINLKLTTAGTMGLIQKYKLPALYSTRDFTYTGEDPSVKKTGGLRYLINSLDFEELIKRRQAEAEYRAEKRIIRAKTRGRVNRPYKKLGRPRKYPLPEPQA
jgi:hypothetical protein